MLRINRILVACDRSQLCERVRSHALDLARRFGSQVQILHVVAPHSRPDSVQLNRAHAVPTGSGVFEVELEARSVPSAILRYAEEQEIDLIVMGGRGNRGLGMRRLSGIAGPVVRYAQCPVLTVRDSFSTHGVQRILVPVDLSPASRYHLEVAKHFARLYEARIDLLFVISESMYPLSSGIGVSIGLEEAVRRQWRHRLEQLWDEVDGPDVPYTAHVRIGVPGPEIINVALQTAPDLIVIGTHGRTGLRRLAMGSVAETVVYRALTATLTVKTFGRTLLDDRTVADSLEIAT